MIYPLEKLIVIAKAIAKAIARAIAIVIARAIVIVIVIVRLSSGRPAIWILQYWIGYKRI